MSGPIWTSAILALAMQATLPPHRSAEAVRLLPTFASLAATPRHTELTIRWIVVDPPARGRPAPDNLITPRSQPEVNRFLIEDRRTIDDSPARERAPRIGPDDLVLVAVNDQDQEIAWHHLTDPRLVRGEHTGTAGVLEGRSFHRTETQFIIRIPASPNITTIRVYDVESSGSDLQLRGLGTIAVSR
jgi:hypothetical protein